ncbi:type I DNA topoisomerase [Rickettsia prowazekii]|uniref:DNA topoisomerase 1 n=2 Tax=Rickettsia prowazekii TaxID=782 RepID=TOP1_RICPR|nr:type I DNA topoisomerase [Rickettsia prowazekii]Q9ZDK2.1 RecName: Full=DNA topoisomerase 1; AltName: Full=DNA topoisomerase I; AltName: Full=Omega-protein; AltName: Full=Relaxing enzyme; AltName: Full=Swivelase; AltName: Full=Untwisting enzyme [Rickettsia prowazekii str. Madrid E]ADE29844.1 DNA topoisomerase I [Rickettsia prowazekii str. Rp22]AFE49143.1 DNA topoisomerase I [Rickettsia prowazekii str. Chernikova]AFE49989.1 DNA topoisomerase I [Rickettsia prowazekii str. Katsinyian]AFE50833.1
MKLVIVESPAKAKTINKYLGDEFKVIASFGHIRDLPSKKGSVLPDKNFLMEYDISDKAGKYVDAIVKEARKAEVVYLATDPDREGESISWHVAEVIKEKNKVESDDFFKRVAFNEITKKAIMNAVANPRKLDTNLVNAQQARRALDYLVGFTLSPLLWRKLPGCKSAGRVQSVALRLICDREDEIERFKSEEYWDISLKMQNSNNDLFTAKLTHVNDQKLKKFSIINEKEAKDLTQKLKLQKFYVEKIEKKQQKRQPQPPFITSSLQQEAARKLGFSAKKTMQIAQKLYEGVDIGKETIGLITYMRTDGVTLSNDAIADIRKLIDKNYGNQYLPIKPRIYQSKVKNAQEAHEAIRPTNITYTPDSLKQKLEKDYYKLYELIWHRTIACQMENVIMDLVIANLASENKEYLAKANGSIIAFDGFYKVYRESLDDEDEEDNKMLPPLKEQEHIKTKEVIPNKHFTEPPPRYSEASLVKKLEELGIGRPSTYASILSVLQDRKYVALEKKRFIPEELGRLVTVFLVGFFKKYVEYDFTAGLENELDEIAAGKLEWKTALNNFWRGFNHNIESVNEQKITEIINYLQKALDYHLFGEDKESKVCPSCKTGQLSLKLGKFGAFLACSNYPECTFKKSIVSGNDNNEDEGDPSTILNDNKILGTDQDGVEIYLKKGPYGPYIQLGEQCGKVKPKRTPVPANLKQSEITLEIALKLLNLPLKIGIHKDSGEEIIIGYSKFGPYIKYMCKFISVPKKYDFLNLSLNDAMKLIQNNKAKLEKKYG